MTISSSNWRKGLRMIPFFFFGILLGTFFFKFIERQSNVMYVSIPSLPQDSNHSFSDANANAMNNESDVTDATDAKQYLKSNRVCKKHFDYLSKNPEWVWSPQSNRFLMATCTMGQFSNRFQCLKNTILIASALNRTAVIPLEDLSIISKQQPYNFSLAIDFHHIISCLGESSIITIDQLAQKFPNFKNSKNQIQVQRLLCVHESCDYLPNNWSSILLPSVKERVDDKIISSFSSSFSFSSFVSFFGNVLNPLISLGDLYNFKLDIIWRVDGLNVLNFKKSENCKLILKPHSAIVKAARGFVRQYTGTEFAAIHLRRSDFYRDLPYKKHQQWSILQVAQCMVSKMKYLKLRLLFIASDAKKSELDLLQSLLLELPPPGEAIATVRLPAMKGEIWAKDLDEWNASGDALAIAMVEKLVSAMSATFFYSRGSTFSDHIIDFRIGLNQSSCEDQEICRRRVWKDMVPAQFLPF